MAGVLYGLAASWAFASTAKPAPQELEELDALLNQPVYAASKFAQAAEQAPAAVTVLTAGDIRAYGWRTLAEVLEGARGVHLRDDRLYTYVGVRGFNRPGDYTSRLLLLVDGQRINDNVYDQAANGREFVLDVEMIERVEFLPGPGSALYGSNAVLGVVNVITRSAASLGGARGSVEWGSARSRALRATFGHAQADLALVLSALSERRPGRDHYYAEYDTPTQNNGLAQGLSGERNDKLFGKLTMSQFTLSGLWSQRQKATPAAPYEVVFNDPLTDYRDNYAALGAAWQSDVSQPHSYSVNLGVNSYRYRDVGRYVVDGLRTDSSASGDWLTLDARWTARAWAGHVIVGGVEWQRNLRQDQQVVWMEPTPQIGIDLRATSQRLALYVNDEWTLSPKWKLSWGARADRSSNGNATLTPRFASIWNPAPRLVVKLMAGQAFREPNAFESSYRDGSSYLANPDLKRERLNARELAVDWQPMSRWRLTGSVYQYRVKNLIEQETDVDTGMLVFYNRGAAKAQGLELESDFVAEAGWRLRGSLTLQQAEDLNGQRLSDSPRSLIKVHALVPVPGVPIRAGVQWLRVGERLTLGGQPVAAYQRTSLTAQYSPAGPFSVDASLYNLTDTAYADPVGGEYRQTTLARDGRAWRIQLNWRH
jgi:outer membrane receptor protein involved in Fe transport